MNFGNGKTLTAAMQRSRGGFTLIEIVVVIGLIVLLLGIATAAFNTISGSRSLEIARNQVGAMLSQARRTAMSGGQTAGVLFFFDPDTERTTMVPVYFPDAPPGWTSGDTAHHDDFRSASVPTGNLIVYHKGDRVMRLWAEPTGTFNGINGEGTAAAPRPFVRYYTCIQDHTPDWNSSTLTGTNDPRFPLNSPHDQYWKLDAWAEAKPVEEADWQTLPPGVGLQLINDPGPSVPLVPGEKPHDYYVGCGTIAFDKFGHLIETEYTIRNTATLGTSTYGHKLQIIAPMPATNTEPYPRTCFGVALFDREAFKTVQNVSAGDWQNSTSFDPAPGIAPNTLVEEQEEEKWLQTNAMHLMANRLNATLSKAE